MIIMIIIMIIIMMTLGNSVIDIAASRRTWYGWSGLQAGLQSNWKSTLIGCDIIVKNLRELSQSHERFSPKFKRNWEQIFFIFLRSSSIICFFEVVFHIEEDWEKIFFGRLPFFHFF
jgi:hypothetical protein